MINFDFAMSVENKNKSDLYIEDIKNIFKEILEIDVQIEFDGTTYEIDDDAFRLTFNIEDDYLTILNIEVINEGQGMGRKIVEILHDFAKKDNLEVRATKVKSEAIGFWQSLGYEEGSEEGEYFLAR